jgi:flagellar hook assembly protein FlgD
MSYKTDATESGNDFEKIKVFPNPVRENFTGVITIDGLVDGSLVKITDAAGNLVYRTKSNGGRAVWDGRNLSGRRVVAGVYFILGSVERGGETKSGVGKFLLIR